MPFPTNLNVTFQEKMNEDEWEEILQRFTEEGLNTTIADDRKLLYVWRWLVDAETNCISLRHQLDKLGKKQAEELKEIRSCMEQMCNSWELKVSNLKQQNQRFQEQLSLNSQSAGSLAVKEIRQMLMEEGLHDILGFSIAEQFACVLDNLARMKQQLDQEIERRRKCEQLARVVSNLPDCMKMSSPQIQRMLERQKDEYEEEIRHQQETMKHVKEQLKLVHEDELNQLVTEKDNLNVELHNAGQRIQELVAHIAGQQGKDASNIPWVQHILDGSHERELKEAKCERDQLRAVCQEQQKQIREQGEAVRMLERANKQLELDNDTLAYKLSEALSQIDELENQLQKEIVRARRDSILMHLSATDSFGVKNMNKQLDNRPNYQEPLEQVKELQTESAKLQEQLEVVEKQLENVTMKYQQHKARHRDKVFQLRDMQDREQQVWKERFESCQKELAFVKSMLSREQECQRNQSDNQRLHNGGVQETTHNSGAITEHEMECLKSTSAAPSHTSTGSPSRRNMVWPMLSQPKQW